MTTNEQSMDGMEPQHRLNRNFNQTMIKHVYITKYILNVTFRVNYKFSM